jgi:hypothetical protein
MKNKFSCILTIIFLLFLQIVNAQNNIIGRWSITDLRADDFPQGMIAYLTQNSFNSFLKEKKLTAADSAEVKVIVKESWAEIMSGTFFQFNPDGTCTFSAEKGSLLKAKYKLIEKENTIILTINKNQQYEGDMVSIKGKEKLKLYYSFEDEELRLDWDEGNTRFYLKKD